VVIDAALDVVRARFTRGSTLTSPRAMREFLRLQLHLWNSKSSARVLDNRHRVLAYEEMFRGTIDGASVYPARSREASVGAQCRRSGRRSRTSLRRRRAQPSRRIDHPAVAGALALVGIRLLDHMVVGADAVCSMRSVG